MGLLDDAIRDHLELKRRRGADAGELAQAEREALGPVRREPIERREQDFGEQDRHQEPELAYEREDRSNERGDHVGLAEPPPFNDDDGFGGGESGAHFSEAEYEEYYEEEYYDEETEGSREALSEEAYPDPVHRAVPSEPTSGRGASVPPESAPPTQATPPEPGETGLDEETVEYSVDDALRSGPHDPSAEVDSETEYPQLEREDVLEETPEFLQDAPEHDRLWFEQRPPRDFDFDG